MGPLPPLALGFFGLGTGYYIYGGWEFFGIPKDNSEKVSKVIGQWGIWMPGFLQFLAGTYLFLGLTVFNAFQGTPVLYMAALAFTAYGVHWFALGLNKYYSGDTTVDGYMAIAFLWISITGAFVFFKAGDYPVTALFILLALVYISDIPASLVHSKKMVQDQGLLASRHRNMADVPNVCSCHNIRSRNASPSLTIQLLNFFNSETQNFFTP